MQKVEIKLLAQRVFEKFVPICFLLTFHYLFNLPIQKLVYYFLPIFHSIIQIISNQKARFYF